MSACDCGGPHPRHHSDCSTRNSELLPAPLGPSYGFDALIEAANIFKRYETPSFPFHCEHDVLFVAVNPEGMTKDDLERLSELGFDPGEDEGFNSYRFGSC